jgi:glutamyl-tRNA synthetase
VLNPEGERLAKRDRPASIAGLRESGVAPERVVGEMARSLGILDGDGSVRPSDLVDLFSWERVSREPWSLTPDVLGRLMS